MLASVTISVGWDMGHRLPNHDGLCRNLHGHHYTAEVTVPGRIKAEPGAPDEGMVVDFTSIKNKLRDFVKGFDHGFMLHHQDPHAGHMKNLPGMFFVGYVPTAENIARSILTAFPEVSKVRLWETPTSFAEVER